MNGPLFRASILPLALLAAACGASGDGGAAEPPPLAGARIGGPFTLTSEDGRTVTDRDFAGRPTLVYFGYTFCPDVCPTDVQRLMAGLRALEKRDPALAGRLQPLFVSIDPERDTPARLRTFTDAFHPRLIGLTGTPEQVAQAAERYAVFYSKVDGSAPDAYLMNHSNQAYLMGADGRPLALIRQDATPDRIAEELQRWMR